MSEDKIELTEEMVNTLENPPKANDAFKAAAKKYKGEDIKMADVFNLPVYQCKSSKKIIKDSRYDALARYDWEKEAEAAVIAINNHDKLTQQVAELRAALSECLEYVDADFEGKLKPCNPAHLGRVISKALKEGE